MYAKIGFKQDKEGIIVKQDPYTRHKLHITSNFEDCKDYYQVKI